MEITVTLPIYVKTSKKKKEQLVGLNWFRNAHYQTKDKIKKHYHKLVSEQLSGVKYTFEKQIQVKYQLFYKNSNSDLMNVVSVIDKFLLDALQECNVISNDNMKKYVYCEAKVGKKDIENPRLVCVISEVEQ